MHWETVIHYAFIIQRITSQISKLLRSPQDAMNTQTFQCRPRAVIAQLQLYCFVNQRGYLFSLPRTYSSSFCLHQTSSALSDNSIKTFLDIKTEFRHPNPHVGGKNPHPTSMSTYLFDQSKNVSG